MSLLIRPCFLMCSLFSSLYFHRWELSVVVRKVSMILVGGVFGFHLKPDMQVHLALFLIALMIVAHLVARPFDELTKAHRVLQWLELGSLCVCWLTLHAGTVFFIGEKEGRISHESLTALSFYVVGGNMCFTLYLMAVYVRAAFRESRTGGVAEQRRKSQLVAAQQARRLSLNAALGKKAVLRKVKSQKARALVSAATTATVAHREALVDRRSAALKRLKRRLESRMKRRRVGVETAVETGVKVDVTGAKTGDTGASAHVGVETSAHVDVAGAKMNAKATAEATAEAIAAAESATIAAWAAATAATAMPAGEAMG